MDKNFNFKDSLFVGDEPCYYKCYDCKFILCGFCYTYGR